jgi:hypothetical protein
MAFFEDSGLEGDDETEDDEVDEVDEEDVDEEDEEEEDEDEDEEDESDSDSLSYDTGNGLTTRFLVEAVTSPDGVGCTVDKILGSLEICDLFRFWP